MVVCDGEHFLQSLISMGIAVEINGKSQCYMWPCVSVASAISCDSLKIAPPVLFLFLAIVFQRFSHLFLLLTDDLEPSSPHLSACMSLSCWRCCR